MTEHSKIGHKSGASSDKKRASLFERADAVFGLDNLGPAAVPKDLPAPKMPAARPSPVPQAAVQSQAHLAEPAAMAQASASTAAPIKEPAKEERAVTLCGPRVEISRDLLREANLIVPEEPVTGLLEEFRIVKRELLADARAANNASARRILVCSPHPGEGKTYCATNLAIALAAERDVEVVLIDADVINPSVTRRLGIEAGPGLMDAVADKTLKPEELVSPTDIAGLFIMSAGTSSTRDAEYLTSTRTAQVLDRLTMGASNRFVIFDTPPALAASPAAELAAHVGQALLVVRADETSRAALDDARQLLSACPDIKLLLNAVQFSPSGRHFGDYGEKEE
ncbi:P-loop NTPase [Qipengyuania sp. ASV99]|uniref:P-loop NTPase n=1 Tax=Qipengyuania sp. ASV99 TaxID=3399681 RepID=UPI003A4C54DC